MNAGARSCMMRAEVCDALVEEKAVENPYMKAGMNRSREPVFAA